MNKIIGIAIGIGGFYIIKEDWKRFKKQQDQKACMYLQEKLNKIKPNRSELIYLNKNCSSRCIEKMMMDFTQRTRQRVGLKVEINSPVNAYSNECIVTTKNNNNVMCDSIVGITLPDGRAMYTNYYV